MTTTAVPDSISSRENCDRCPARAQHRATIDVLSLSLCNHHYTKHRDAMDTQGWVFIAIAPED